MTAKHTFTLAVDRLDAQDQGQLSDVVIRAHYTVWGEDQQGNRVPYYGSVDLPAPTAGDFVPFEELGKIRVTEWVETAIGEDEMTRITDQLTVQLGQEDIVGAAVKNVAPPWLQ